jgi:hypothetical protein
MTLTQAVLKKTIEKRKQHYQQLPIAAMQRACCLVYRS